LDSPVIDSNQTSREITDRIVEIVKNAVKENLIIRNICEKIIKSIHSEMDGHWNCQAFYDNIGYNHSLKYPDFNVRIDFGKLSIIVYKSYDDVSIESKKISLHQILCFSREYSWFELMMILILLLNFLFRLISKDCLI
jgi:hypothetical protein